MLVGKLKKEFSNHFVVTVTWIDAGARQNLDISPISNSGKGGVKLTMSEFWGA